MYIKRLSSKQLYTRSLPYLMKTFQTVFHSVSRKSQLDSCTVNMLLMEITRMGYKIRHFGVNGILGLGCFWFLFFVWKYLSKLSFITFEENLRCTSASSARLFFSWAQAFPSVLETYEERVWVWDGHIDLDIMDNSLSDALWIVLWIVLLPWLQADAKEGTALQLFPS